MLNVQKSCIQNLPDQNINKISFSKNTCLQNNDQFYLKQDTFQPSFKGLNKTNLLKIGSVFGGFSAMLIALLVSETALSAKRQELQSVNSKITKQVMQKIDPIIEQNPVLKTGITENDVKLFILTKGLNPDKGEGKDLYDNFTRNLSMNYTAVNTFIDAFNRALTDKDKLEAVNNLVDNVYKFDSVEKERVIQEVANVFESFQSERDQIKDKYVVETTINNTIEAIWGLAFLFTVLIPGLSKKSKKA